MNGAALTRTRARRVVKIVAGILQALLIARIVLLLFAPSAADPIATWFLGLTQPLSNAANAVLPVVMRDQFGGSIFDLDAVYALIGITLVEGILLWLIDRQAGRREALPTLPSMPEPTAGALPRDLVAVRAERSMELQARFGLGTAGTGGSAPAAPNSTAAAPDSAAAPPGDAVPDRPSKPVEPVEPAGS